MAIVCKKNSHKQTVLFFLIDEGPRSRRYGRTAALRLIVQPSDYDDYYYFCHFPSNGAPVE
jgi:hypothetical protein